MPRFLFYLPASPKPAGGVNVILNFAEQLRNGGFEAEVICSRAYYRYVFRETEPKIYYVPQIKEPLSPRQRYEWCVSFVKGLISGKRNTVLVLRDSDVIVVPEMVSYWLPQFFPRHRFVLLSQGYVKLISSFLHKDWRLDNFSQALSISDICTQTLKMIKVPNIHQVPSAVDVEQFHFHDEKEDIIAYMPAKLPDDARSVVEMAKRTGIADGYKFVPIVNMSYEQVPKILAKARFFLSFPIGEGFGLPAAEAMASGCVVVGYSGIGGAEFFDSEVGYQVENRDLVGFIDALGKAIHVYKNDPQSHERMRRKASERIVSNYRAELQKSKLVEVFREISRKLR